MKGIVITIPYVSIKGSTESLRMTVSLMSSVTNASSAESNQEVKVNAPGTYYTQNRMITGEDYNLAPLSVSQSIAKVKAVNRTTSGISRNFDLVDPTGKYSTTSSFCTDGIIYREEIQHVLDFRFLSRTDIDSLITNQIQPLTKLSLMRDFYYEKYSPKNFVGVTLTVNTVAGFNDSTGYVIDKDSKPQAVGVYAGTAGTLRFLEPGAMVKFVPPAGKYFAANGTLVSTPSTTTTNRLWVKVVGVTGDGTGSTGTGLLSTGLGPILFGGVVPSGAVISRIIPKFLGYIPTDIQSLMIDLIFNYRNFGLRYSIDDRTWLIIQDRNLDVASSWSTSNAGNNSGAKLDSSWLIAFETDGEKYKVTYRGLEYYFESIIENKFFFDGTRKIYDTTTGKIQKDKISVLKFNTNPNDTTTIGRDYPWEIVGTTLENDGYVSSKSVKISFYDSNDDGIVDDPEAFDVIVDPSETNTNRFVFFEKYITDNNNEDYRYISNDNNKFLIYPAQSSVGSLTSFADGQLFYFYNSDTVKVYNKAASTLTTTRDYYANIGRSQMYFHYLHNADSTTRIDPSSSNIMDIFLLTKDYDINYRKYVRGDISVEPLPSSSTDLKLTYGTELNKIKSISDDIVYHPVRYKTLFGSTADSRLQATFLVVKNKEQVITDNDVKTRVILAINRYFSLENWEFGDDFYFSELNAYVMNQVSPFITSFVIVPSNGDQVYGSLQQIASAPNEIFISSATVSNVEIIESLTASRLKTAGYIVTSSTTDYTTTNYTSSVNN
jgi:hypothetical protein